MADILIRGMEMPKTCSQCPMCYDYMMCKLNHFSFWNTNESFDCCEDRLAGCPLHELPEHGDLIDRDAFREENEYYLHREFINPKYEDTLDDLLKDAPVIIPASKEETE